MKGCLKLSASYLESDRVNTARKCVAFGAEGSDEVYPADEWDRTPMEPARKLTYSDMLELKEIQRSLPRAPQLADPLSGKPASLYLSAVPIGLLPLLPEKDNDGSPTSSATPSPFQSPVLKPVSCSGSNLGPRWMPPPPPAEPRTPTPEWHPPHLSHLLPGQPAVVRQKPKFSFVPLLDTPPSSAASSPYPSCVPSRSPSPDLISDTDQSQDPPTPSLTNASLDSSPLSHASSTSSPEPSFFQLPPPRGRPFEAQPKSHDSYFHLDDNLSRPPLPQPSRRRNFIVVNDMEIEVDGDDGQDVEVVPPSPGSSIYSGYDSEASSPGTPCSQPDSSLSSLTTSPEPPFLAFKMEAAERTYLSLTPPLRPSEPLSQRALSDLSPILMSALPPVGIQRKPIIGFDGVSQVSIYQQPDTPCPISELMTKEELALSPLAMRPRVG